MSKAVLISIRPKWCELIASGKKTIEVRKTAPKIPTPYKCYIYCTMNTHDPRGWLGCYDHDFHRFGLISPMNIEAGKHMNIEVCSGKVIGEFVCDRMDTLSGRGVATEEYLRDVCLTVDQYNAYRKGRATYFWHISDLVIYDEPKELSDFMKPCDPDPDGIPLCLQCKRLVENYGCGGTILRPPQSWCYVEEIV